MIDGLISILKDIAGIDVDLAPAQRSVTDANQPWVMPDVITQALLTVKYIAVRELGSGDEEREEWDPSLAFPGDPIKGGFRIGVTGPRVLTFSVSCECHDSAKSAFEYIERIRSNIYRSSIRDRISAIGCSLNMVTASRDGSYVREGRIVTKAGFDLLLNATSNIDDDPVSTINTVNVTHTTT